MEKMSVVATGQKNNPRIAHLGSNIGLGSTEPKYAVLEDGTQVVVKLFNGPEGNLVLFNEYLSYRLAILLDIPMPRSGICLFDETSEIQDTSIADSTNFGTAFYSEYLQKVTKLVPSIIGKIGNRDDFIKILLFDHVIFNTDRNPGNLLVRFYKEDISLKVIDHTHVFVNQAIWDSTCLRQAIAEKDLLSTRVLEYNSYLYDMFRMNIPITKERLENESLIFKKRINRDILLRFIDKTPIEWRPSSEDIEVLIEYLMYRVANLDTILSTILTYWK